MELQNEIRMQSLSRTLRMQNSTKSGHKWLQSAWFLSVPMETTVLRMEFFIVLSSYYLIKIQLIHYFNCDLLWQVGMWIMHMVKCYRKSSAHRIACSLLLWFHYRSSLEIYNWIWLLWKTGIIFLDYCRCETTSQAVTVITVPSCRTPLLTNKNDPLLYINR